MSSARLFEPRRGRAARARERAAPSRGAPARKSGSSTFSAQVSAGERETRIVLVEEAEVPGAEGREAPRGKAPEVGAERAGDSPPTGARTRPRCAAACSSSEPLRAEHDATLVLAGRPARQPLQRHGALAHRSGGSGRRREARRRAARSLKLIPPSSPPSARGRPPHLGGRRAAPARSAPPRAAGRRRPRRPPSASHGVTRRSGGSGRVHVASRASSLPVTATITKPSTTPAASPTALRQPEGPPAHAGPERPGAAALRLEIDQRVSLVTEEPGGHEREPPTSRERDRRGGGRKQRRRRSRARADRLAGRPRIAAREETASEAYGGRRSSAPTLAETGGGVETQSSSGIAVGRSSAPSAEASEASSAITKLSAESSVVGKRRASATICALTIWSPKLSLDEAAGLGRRRDVRG